jgi:hypothetical protein
LSVSAKETFENMIFGPSVVCLLALVLVAHGAAAADEQQPPLQTSNHGGSHAPIKVAKRQENVENAELTTDDAEGKETSPKPKDGQTGPDAVAAGKGAGRRPPSKSCRCPY